MKNELLKPAPIWIDWGTGWKNPELRVDFADDTHHVVELIGVNDKEALLWAMRQMANILEATL